MKDKDSNKDKYKDRSTDKDKDKYKDKDKDKIKDISSVSRREVTWSTMGDRSIQRRSQL